MNKSNNNKKKKNTKNPGNSPRKKPLSLNAISKTAMQLKPKDMVNMWPVLLWGLVFLIIVIAAVAAIPDWKKFIILVLFGGFYFFASFFILRFSNFGKSVREIHRDKKVKIPLYTIIRAYLKNAPLDELYEAYKHAREHKVYLSFEDLMAFRGKGLDLEKIVLILSLLHRQKAILDKTFFLQYLRTQKISNHLLDAFLLKLQRDLPTNFHELAYLDSWDQKLTQAEREKQGSKLQEHLEVLLSYVTATEDQKETFQDLMRDFQYSTRLTKIINVMKKCHDMGINWSKDEIKGFQGDHDEMIKLFLKARQYELDVSIQDIVKMHRAGISNIEKKIDMAATEQEHIIEPFTVYTNNDQPVKLTVVLTYKHILKHTLKGRGVNSLIHNIREAYTSEIGNIRYERIFGRASEISRRVRNLVYKEELQVIIEDLSITNIEVVSIYGAPRQLEKANYERAVEQAEAERIKARADAHNREARARIRDLEARIKEAEAKYRELQVKNAEKKSE